MVKKSLQFLNMLCSSLKKPSMFLIWHTYQVFRAIVTPDAVKMMHYPTLRQRLPMSLFPDKYMLSYISLWVCSWMVGLQNKYIAGANLVIPSTFPRWMLFPFSRGQYPQLPSQLHFTTSASSSSGTHFSTAIWAVRFTSAFKIIKAFPAYLRTKALPFTLRRELFTALLAVMLPFHTLIVRVNHK